MAGIFKNIEEYNPHKNSKILIVFDDMIADIFSNKKLNPVVTEVFIKGRKPKISPVFITQSCFAVPKNIRFALHFAFNESLDIDVQDFMNLYKKCTAKPYSFSGIDATLASDNPLCFRNNLLERIQKLIMKIDDKI